MSTKNIFFLFDQCIYVEETDLRMPGVKYFASFIYIWSLLDWIHCMIVIIKQNVLKIYLIRLSHQGTY